MKHLIHANSSRSVGIGHLMRVFALSEEMLNRGQEVLFVTCSETPNVLRQKWKSIGVEVIIEDGNKGTEALAREIICLAEKKDIDWPI